jgi:hypothetical protein
MSASLLTVDGDNMSANLLIIECGRCGVTRLESLAKNMDMAASNAIGPLMNYCAQCRSTTGWLPWRRRSNDELVKRSKVPAGQERLATQSELAAISEMLQKRKAARTVPVSDEGGINRFLLCTIVWGVAREVKAEGETNGERMPLQRIAREVLSSYLQEWVPSGLYLLEEEALEDAIKRRLSELFKQSRIQNAEERRFDIDTLIAAEQIKRRSRKVKR